jgi:hypothetical protein
MKQLTHSELCNNSTVTTRCMFAGCVVFSNPSFNFYGPLTNPILYGSPHLSLSLIRRFLLGHADENDESGCHCTPKLNGSFMRDFAHRRIIAEDKHP